MGVTAGKPARECSLAHLVACDEIIGWVRRFMDPVVVDDETLALDLIEQVAPNGEYLTQRHTRARFRDDWYPKLHDHRRHDAWAKDGSRTLEQRAAARAEELLASHRVPPLEPAVLAAVEAAMGADLGEKP